MIRPPRYEDKSCMICKRRKPPGHVLVISERGHSVVGRICSSHTLAEVILDKEDRFNVLVMRILS